MMKTTKQKQTGGKQSPDVHKKFGVFIVDGDGIAVRCFDAKKSAWRWTDKHWPDLAQDEKKARIRTFRSYAQVRRFFDEQVRKGNANAEVLALMTYYCGTSTSRGMNLKNGHTFELAGKNN